MKYKKHIMAAAVILIMATVFTASFGIANFKVSAANENAGQIDVSHYFKDQLNTDAQKQFYSAMQKMLDEEMFIKGESLDLIDKGYFTAEDVTNDASGRENLIAEFGAARDAFYFDHPDVFYVDFSAFSLRATTDVGGGYHLYLGTGRYDTYYTEGFETEIDVRDAIAAYNEALDAFVEDVKANCARDAKKETLRHAEVEYAHDKLANLVTYKLDNECTEENRGFIRTAYGALVCKEGVCEAYTRAFKAVMDKLGIPCVMVQGVYRHNDDKHGSEDGVDELHIWNYVYLNDPIAIVEKVGTVGDGENASDKTELKEIAEGETGGWYAVDVTMDDPKYENGENHPTTEYLLAGSSLMARNHIPNGVVSASNFEFDYPILAIEGYGVTYTEYESKDKTVILKIGYNPYSLSDGDTIAGQYIVSINVDGVDMGVAAAKEKGYYLIGEFGIPTYTEPDENGLSDIIDRYDENGAVVMTPWSYIDEDVYGIVDEAGYSDFRFAQTNWIKFGVTKIKWEYDPDNPPEKFEDVMKFNGDVQNDIIAQTDKPLHNISGGYKAPPYPDLKLSTPSMQGNLDIDGRTYEIKIVWDDTLVRTPNAKGDPKIVVHAEHWLGDKRVYNQSAVDNCVIENFKWDGDKTTTFDFTPSNMFMDDGVVYTFYIEGLVGQKSGKLPIEFSYVASHPCAIHQYSSQGIDWNGFGKPFLMDDNVTEENLEEVLRARLTLVAIPTTTEENKAMENALETNPKTQNDKILGSQTYNISLNACKKNVPKTGQSLRISLGFPDGYGPDDAGVTFKAYHFITDDNGKITGVEEIPCIVTEYGLILLVNSFSPFEIAAVETTAETQSTARNVIITSSKGGSFTTEGGKAMKENGGAVVVEKDGTLKITITAEEGYVIDTLTSNGENVKDSTGKDELVLEIPYDDISEKTAAIVDVKFMAASVKEAEATNNQTPVVAQATKAEIETISETSVNVKDGESITVSVEVSEGQHTYQWFRKVGDNEVAVVGQTKPMLTIENATEEDSGEYFLRVTTISGATTASIDSVTITITISGSGSTGGESTGGEPEGGGSTGDEPSGGGSTGDESTGDESTGGDPADSDPAGSETTGSETTGSETTGSETTGSETTGSDPAGSETTGSETTGNETTGSEPADSETTGEPEVTTGTDESTAEPETGEPETKPDGDVATPPDTGRSFDPITLVLILMISSSALAVVIADAKLRKNRK